LQGSAPGRQQVYPAFLHDSIHDFYILQSSSYFVPFVYRKRLFIMISFVFKRRHGAGVMTVSEAPASHNALTLIPFLSGSAVEAANISASVINLKDREWGSLPARYAAIGG
jgi:hypothetical protein